MLAKLNVPGVCCPVHLLSFEPPDSSLCSICYQIMTHPVKLECGHKISHVFGVDCIEEWWKKKGNKFCPYCRKIVNGYSVEDVTKSGLKDWKLQCDVCQWSGRVERYPIHKLDCEGGLHKAMEYLQTITNNPKIDNQKKDLQAEKALWILQQSSPEWWIRDLYTEN